MKKINKTLKAAKVSRRSVLKGAAATGAAAAIGPWYIPNAFKYNQRKKFEQKIVKNFTSKN